MKKVPPRVVPVKDEFYLGMAFWAASRSKDPNTQHGAQIVSVDYEPLGWGYNGLPKPMSDTDISWGRPEKYEYIIHAEINAIKHSRGDLKGSIMYVTGKPCKSCMIDIANAQISKVVWFPSKHDAGSMMNSVDMDKTDELAKLGGVILEQYEGNLSWMEDQIELMRNRGIFD